MFCLFYTDHVQCRFFAELYERIWIMENYMWKFSFEFFDTLKYIFLACVAYAHVSRIEFPVASHPN
jgi:hypothetical protein